MNLTDLETCYKAVNTTLLKSIPLRSDDFRIEVELPFKLAKRGARARDGILALRAMVQFTLIDDLYQRDEYGSQILVSLERARRFNGWMAGTVRPFVGKRVLEIGAGIGSLTSHLIPRELYVASDINPHYLHYLRSYASGKPYLHVRHIDVTCADDVRPLAEQFDTVIMLNVLEHVPDEAAALRYVSVPGWWVNGKVLRRRTFSRVQLKVLDVLMPILKPIDRFWPWQGLSLIVVARKPVRAEVTVQPLTATGRDTYSIREPVP